MSAPEKWEYTVHRMINVGSDQMIGILTKHGDDGWELVGLHPQPPHTHLVFKRRKQ